MRRSTADLDGALDPIRISFAAEGAVYPMRLSAGATTFGDWIDPSKAGAALAILARGDGCS